MSSSLFGLFLSFQHIVVSCPDHNKSPKFVHDTMYYPSKYSENNLEIPFNIATQYV